MPSTNTSYLAKTFVGFARQFLSVPSGRDTYELKGQLTQDLFSFIIEFKNRFSQPRYYHMLKFSNVMKSFIFIMYERLLLHITEQNTFESFSFCNSNHVDHFVFSKNILDRNLLFEMFSSKIDLKLLSQRL